MCGEPGRRVGGVRLVEPFVVLDERVERRPAGRGGARVERDVGLHDGAVSRRVQVDQREGEREPAPDRQERRGRLVEVHLVDAVGVEDPRRDHERYAGRAADPEGWRSRQRRERARGGERRSWRGRVVPECRRVRVRVVRRVQLPRPGRLDDGVDAAPLGRIDAGRQPLGVRKSGRVELAAAVQVAHDRERDAARWDGRPDLGLVGSGGGVVAFDPAPVGGRAEQGRGRQRADDRASVDVR